MARKCRYCKAELPKVKDCVDPIQAKGFCTFDHAAKYGLQKAQQAKERQERKELKARKERLKTKRDWVKEAQPEFNRFIRFRDWGKPCISCDTPIEEIESNQGWKVGGAWDCGHYLSVGSHYELRFEEDNAHRQCKSCNAGSKKFAHKARSVATRYREKLIDRIGLKQVEWLEGPHDAKNYTIEDLKEIKAKYRKKANELKNEIDLISQ